MEEIENVVKERKENLNSVLKELKGIKKKENEDEKREGRMREEIDMKKIRVKDKIYDEGYN